MLKLIELYTPKKLNVCILFKVIKAIEKLEMSVIFIAYYKNSQKLYNMNSLLQGKCLYGCVGVYRNILFIF